MGAQASELPRVRVAALINVNGKIVLARHRAGERVYHLLPGGGVGYRETIADALEREVREETGLVVKTGRPLLISDTIDPGGSRHLVNLTFEAIVVGGSITDYPEDERVEAVDLIAPEQLGSLDLRPPMAGSIVEAIRRGTDFPATYLGSLFTDDA